MTNRNEIVVGIITISDRASAGHYEDLGGPALKDAAQKAGWQVLSEAIVPDHAERIQQSIRSFSQQGCGLILTTGGTGVGPRDVTPEAIRAIMRVELPGFGEVMRAESMKITPNSILSRERSRTESPSRKGRLLRVEARVSRAKSAIALVACRNL